MISRMFPEITRPSTEDLNISERNLTKKSRGETHIISRDGGSLDKQESVNVHENEGPFIKNGVRIEPGCMIFKDAYDGKSFKQALTITNCGKTSVNIRIFSPTSKAFKIKPMPIGHTLSPGLSIVRKIKYLYTTPTAIPQACMDIYINNDCVRYELLVNICFARVQLTPKVLDFGEIDVGRVSEVKKIAITNCGTKQAQFAVDLGRNQLEILVEPMKGTVQPGETKEMTVEVFGTSESEFNQEFWIKTDPLQRVHIQGQFIKAALKVDYPLADKNLLILNFPKSFVGVRQQRSIMLQNHSSTSAVCCINGRTRDEKLPYIKAMKKDLNFKQFEIVPLEGRLHKDQRFIIVVTFIPQKPINRPNYYICNAVVDMRKCRSIRSLTPKSSAFNPDALGMVQHAPMLESISATTVVESNEPPQEISVLNDMVTILLYGEVELPEIAMDPDRISLRNLKVYQTHVEAVKLMNKSKTLPLIIKYNKIPSLSFEPATIILPPSEIVDATLKLRPTKMGYAIANVVLDIFYQQKQDLIKIGTVNLDIEYSGEYTEDQKLKGKRKPSFLPGITPKNHNEIGYLVDNVKFNSQIEKPLRAIVDKTLVVFNKNNDALIAFPNDRPMAFKPWKSTIPCKTIFAQLPRLITQVDVDYDLTPSQQNLKDVTQSYYLNYIRSLNKPRLSRTEEEELKDYVTTNQKRILMERFKNKALCPVVEKKISNKNLFVPLTPYEMLNTVVSPKFIQLGKLAADSECSDHFNVENKNDFPIHVSIKALYTSIRINQDEFVLGPNSQRDIDFIYHSEYSGSHHISMVIIVNFFHLFDVTVLATIVSNSVICITRDISIVPTEKNAFLELKNPINSDVGFEVDTNFYHLESFPAKGIIPAKRNMTLTITFNPELGCTPVKEIAIISESGAKELVEVNFERKKAFVSVSSECLTFENIPLNTEVTQELVIRNHSDQIVPLAIEFENNTLIPEITIMPTKALLLQKGDITVAFVVKFSEVVRFTVPINLTLQYQYSRQITITGNIVYPDLNFRPELIKIQKIPSGSTVKTPFKVYNASEVTNYLLFPMQEYPEFAIKTKLGENVTEKEITLSPKEKRELFLEFRPQEPVAYCIYLPYILNGIIGPAELNRPDTMQSSYYFNSVNNDYKISEELSSKLNVLKILCAAGKNWLTFSSLELEFYSFRKTSGSITITNVSGVCQEISLNLTNIEPFSIYPTSENMLVDNNEVKAILDPDEACTVSIEFLPSTYCKFQQDIPIFVKDYSEVIAFNYLKLTGDNPEPCISSDLKSVYFIPTKAGSRQTRRITLDLWAHHCEKKVKVNCDCPEIDIVFVSQEIVSELKTVAHFVAVFAPKQSCIVETVVTFMCPCARSASVEIYACGDNSLVINYMSEASVIHQSTYPLFPLDSDTSQYADLMRFVLRFTERWLYTQGYFCQGFYRIPDDIAKYPFEMPISDAHKGVGKPKHPQLPLVQLLINLMNNSILKYIDNGIEPSQEFQKRTIYNYVTYRNTISFLKSQGIHVPGLKPEHLLIYPEHVEFKKSFEKTKGKMIREDFDEETFYRFSKQKWLDLFFHIYKVLVQERVVNPNPSGNATSGQESNTQDFFKKDQEEFEEYFIANIDRFPDWFLYDAKLLLWLDYHYNRQKTVLWPNQKFEGRQHLEDFCDVDDSVALAAVTAYYCPYLHDDLKDIFICPKTIEQKVHNACKVVQSWQNLKLSFDVHPQTIVTANKIKIIFIVTYLYEVLPHFYPTNEVTIEAPLSESASYNLNVQNCGVVPIRYNAIFFGLNANLFKLDYNSISIPAGKTKSLKLTYSAKRVLGASVILVLTGESGGQRYAKSMVATITGVPKTTSSDEIKVISETYKLVKKKIQLKTPYQKNYQAKVFICFEEPKSYEDLHAVSSLKSQYIPREIDVMSTECDFVDKGEASITLTTSFLSRGSRPLYMCFCNDDVGDFCVLVNLISTLSKNRAKVITVDLPQNFNMACSCKRGLNFNCPKAFTVNICCRNELLWKSMEMMIKNCFSESMFKLFKTFFGTPVVFRLLKFYLERFPQGFMLPSAIFDDQVEYTITPSKNFSAALPTIKINDVTSNEEVPLVLHWGDDSIPAEGFLELKSQNGKELRYYKLLFQYSEAASSDSSSKHSQISSADK